MKTGLELMEQRAQQLINGERIPVLERQKTVAHSIITGFSPAEHNSVSYWEDPTDIQIDQNGVLYVNMRVSLIKRPASNGWELGESPIRKK